MDVQSTSLRREVESLFQRLAQELPAHAANIRVYDVPGGGGGIELTPTNPAAARISVFADVSATTGWPVGRKDSARVFNEAVALCLASRLHTTKRTRVPNLRLGRGVVEQPFVIALFFRRERSAGAVLNDYIVSGGGQMLEGVGDRWVRYGRNWNFAFSAVKQADDFVGSVHRMILAKVPISLLRRYNRSLGTGHCYP